MARGEARRLADIRADVAALDGTEWFLASRGDGMLVERAGPSGRRETILHVGDAASGVETRLAGDALAHMRFLLSLVDRAIASIRAHGERACGPASAGAADDGRAPVGASASPGNPKNFAAEAGIACGKPAFRLYLKERHGAAFDGCADDKALAARAAQKLRSVLGVDSRRDLNTDDRARDAWLALRRDFYAWKDTPR